jgi:hypothetical protein
LTIEYDEHSWTTGATTRWRQAMRQIGRGRHGLGSLSSNAARILVGLILGEARHGRNYFDGF